MINEITLTGFKSFFRDSLNLEKLTVLTGLNSSGKSSVIQALRILAKAARKETSFLLPGHGTVEEIRNKNTKEDISLTITDKDNNEFSVTLSGSNSKTTETGNFLFPEITYISAHRYGPQTSIPIYSDISDRSRIGENGENVLQCIELYRDNPLDERLRHETSEGYTLGFNVRGWLNVISPGTEFNWHLDNTSDSSYSTFDGHRANNVGFGLSYTLPVITTLLMSTLTPGSLVIIENPEAHLHSKGQTELAKLIALCAQVGTQIIIETHSDHLFDGIRIAAKELQMADDIQIHWFELDERRNTQVFSPVLTNDGRIDKWPQGFFDQFELNSSQLI